MGYLRSFSAKCHLSTQILSQYRNLGQKSGLVETYFSVIYNGTAISSAIRSCITSAAHIASLNKSTSNVVPEVQTAARQVKKFPLFYVTESSPLSQNGAIY
jgi:hypothetical protein